MDATDNIGLRVHETRKPLSNGRAIRKFDATEYSHGLIVYHWLQKRQKLSKAMPATHTPPWNSHLAGSAACNIIAYIQAIAERSQSTPVISAQ